MPIDTENPTTVLGMVDAAANYVAQIRIALMVNDKAHALHVVEKVAELLHKATCGLQCPEDCHTPAGVVPLTGGAPPRTRPTLSPRSRPQVKRRVL